jgi:dihydroflavonol-4-reductase
MRILVTGSTGFVGSHLMEELGKRDLLISVIVRTDWLGSIPLWLRNTDIFYGDITDRASVRKALKNVDVVFHLASLLGRWQSEYDESEYYRVNAAGTQLLIEECRKENVKHFVYLSSAGVMGRLTKTPADENHPCSPDFPYEKSKYYAEIALNKSIVKDRFPATIIRATHIYGPRDKNTVKVLRTIKQLKIFPLIGGGRSLFQPLYVKDLVKGLVACIEKRDESVGKTYLVAGRDILTYKEFILLSAQILNISLKTFSISEKLASYLAVASESMGKPFNFEPPLTRSRVEFFSRDQTYRTEKIQKEIGFFPKTDIRTGLKNMIDWFEKNARQR